MNLRPTSKIDWLVLLVILMVLLTVIADHAKADTKIGIHGGHWSHHWTSDDITNEEHAWFGVRLNNFTFGRFDNSYKQDGFSGETWYIGAIKDWVWFDNINRWRADIIARGSAGLTYGYTEFADHRPGGNKRVHGYAAGGLYYQQPVDDTFRWEVGAMQFGDATLPSAGLEARF